MNHSLNNINKGWANLTKAPKQLKKVQSNLKLLRIGQNNDPTHWNGLKQAKQHPLEQKNFFHVYI